jgi:hypothetical protein
LREKFLLEIALELVELIQQQHPSLQKSLLPLIVDTAAVAAVVSDDGDMINDVDVDIGIAIC